MTEEAQNQSPFKLASKMQGIQHVNTQGGTPVQSRPQSTTSKNNENFGMNGKSRTNSAFQNTEHPFSTLSTQSIENFFVNPYNSNNPQRKNSQPGYYNTLSSAFAGPFSKTAQSKQNNGENTDIQQKNVRYGMNSQNPSQDLGFMNTDRSLNFDIVGSQYSNNLQSLGNTQSEQYQAQDLYQQQSPVQEPIQEVDNSMNQSLAQESIKPTPHTEVQTLDNQEKQSKKSVSLRETFLQGPKYSTQGSKGLKENKQGNQLSKFFRKLSAKPTSKPDEQIDSIEPNSEVENQENSQFEQSKEQTSNEKSNSKRVKKLQEHTTSLKMSNLFSTASRDVGKNKDKSSSEQQQQSQDKSIEKVHENNDEQQVVQQVEIESEKENLENIENQIPSQDEQQQNQQQNQQQSKKYGLSFQMLDAKNRTNSRKLQSRGSQELPKQKDKNAESKSKEKSKENGASLEDKSNKEEKAIVDGRKQSATLGLFRPGGMESQSSNRSLQKLSVQKVRKRKKKQFTKYLRGFGNNSNNSNTNDAKLERQNSDGQVGAPPGQVGLLNNGNTCFMNAAFQCLRCTPNLIQLLMDELKITDLPQQSQVSEPNSKDEVEINYKKMVNKLDSARSGPLIMSSKNVQQLGDTPLDNTPPRAPSPTAKDGAESDDDKIKAYIPDQDNVQGVNFKEDQRQYSKSITINPDTQKLPLNINNRRNFFSSQVSFLQSGKASTLDRQSVGQINLKGTLNGGDMKFYTPNTRYDISHSRQEHLQKILYDAELKQQLQSLKLQKENEFLKIQYNLDSTHDQKTFQNTDTELQDWQSRFQNPINFKQIPRLQRSWSDIALKTAYRDIENVGEGISNTIFSQPYPPLMSQRFSFGDGSRHSGIHKENSLHSQSSVVTQLTNQNSVNKPPLTPDKSQGNKMNLDKKRSLAKATSLFSFGRRSKDSVANDSNKDRSGSNTARTDIELLKPDIPLAPQLPTYDPAKLHQFKQNPVAQLDTFFLETDLQKLQRQNKDQELNLNYTALNMPQEGVQQSNSPEPNSHDSSKQNQVQQSGTDTQMQNGQEENGQAQNQQIQSEVKDRSIAEVSVELMQKLISENPNSVVNLLDLQLQLQKQPLGKELCDGGQHDSQEFLKILLNCIHTDLKFSKQKETPQQVYLHQQSLKEEIRKQKAQKEKIYEEEVTVTDISTLAQHQHQTDNHDQSSNQHTPTESQVQQNQHQGHLNGTQKAQQVLQMNNRFEREDDGSKDSVDSNHEQDANNIIQSNAELDTYQQMQQLVKQETQRNLTRLNFDQIHESNGKTSQYDKTDSNTSTTDKIGQIQPQNQGQVAAQEQEQQHKINESMTKWLEYVNGEDSIITDLFSGQLQSSVRCHACGTKTNMYEIFQELILPIQREKKGLWNPLKPSITLEELLRVFTAEEEMKGKEAFYCETCKSKQTATKQMLISRFPKILIVQLLRSRDRLNTQVNFPIKNLSLEQFAASSTDDVQTSAPTTEAEPTPHTSRAGNKNKDNKTPLIAKNNKQHKNNDSVTSQNKEQTNMVETNSSKYELYGVINHFGSMSQGHYTSQCKIKTPLEKEEWYLFNDGLVSKTNPDKIVTQNAYMLFYVSKEFIEENKKYTANKDQQKQQQVQQDLQQKIFGSETSSVQ